MIIAALATQAVPRPNDNQFTISAFATSDRSFPATGNDVILAEAGGKLQEVRTVPRLRGGEIIMRRRYDPGEYRLYKGRIDTAAFRRTPPLYSFPFPGWARLADMLKYKVYRDQVDNPSTDEETVYFDNERVYIQYFPFLYYARRGIWFRLEGTQSLPVGALRLTSDPPGARISVDGQQTSFTTPCTIERMIAGRYDIELFLEKYRFYRKSLNVVADSTVTASFELMSDFDTIYISGKAPFGILMLPTPPTDTLFLIDSTPVHALKQRLRPGDHRIVWDGAGKYASIDTTITVPVGKVIYFDSPFRRLFGTLRLLPFPYDAELCLDGERCGLGERIIELPTGSYELSGYRRGYEPLEVVLEVLPDTITTHAINLRARPDRDGDGIPDSVDACPNVYGLFDGCPKRRIGDAIEGKRVEVEEYVLQDPFSAGVSLIGVISRIPTRKHFANFLSTFSSGKIGGVNNYRGLMLANSMQVNWRALYGSFELGQWSAGLQYRRPDTLHLATKQGNYLVFYDSLAGIEPLLILPSTALSCGVHYNWTWLNVVYSFGYQWEDIVIDQLMKESTGELTSVVFDNDWWFHQIVIEGDLRVEESFAPSIYAKFKFPFGSSRRTRWHVMQLGTQIKFTPRIRKVKR